MHPNKIVPNPNQRYNEIWESNFNKLFELLNFKKIEFMKLNYKKTGKK